MLDIESGTRQKNTALLLNYLKYERLESGYPVYIFKLQQEATKT